LAFQLERRFAGGAEVVDGDGVARRDIEPWRFAGGTEKVGRAPGFGADAGALRGAFVVAETGSWKMEVHAGIRSRLIRTNKEAVTVKMKIVARGLRTSKIHKFLSLSLSILKLYGLVSLGGVSRFIMLAISSKAGSKASAIKIASLGCSFP